MTDTQQTHVTASLKQPATMALIELERYKTNPEILQQARIAETGGKCRWQVLNQLKLWITEAEATAN